MRAAARQSLPKPVASGVPGEARTFYFERDFGRHAVKIMPGEFFVARDDVVISTVLGSCVAACIWDRSVRVGGMNHFMLPGEESGAGDLTAASGRYGVFAMEQLINELIKRGARKANLEAKVFGGGAVLRNLSTLNVGERNAAFVLEFLNTEGIRVVSQDLLDVHPRRVAFFPTTGRAMCKKLTQTDSSLVAAEQQYTAKINTTEVAGDIELF
ncbi:putative chemoreceptor glutamine deamidase CheD [Burkholderiales bacterium]|nr:putative chemoreceptor glutamine deamidase CheD [Burkholderiales bacterium]